MMNKEGLFLPNTILGFRSDKLINPEFPVFGFNFHTCQSEIYA